MNHLMSSDLNLWPFT